MMITLKPIRPKWKLEMLTKQYGTIYPLSSSNVIQEALQMNLELKIDDFKDNQG